MTEVVTYKQQVGALTVGDVKEQVNLIQHVMKEVMKRDEHFGVIPGTGNKPTLLKAGAEKLCLTFRLDPQYEVTKEQDGIHCTIMSKCTLYHIPTGQRFGSGMGSCSTRESKYAWRTGKRKCPSCGVEAINKSKFPPKGAKQGTPPGFYCYAKQGGCGMEFDHDDTAITGQVTGRVANEDVADQYNTVLKMANKRSLVAAVLNATAASDIFTQDIEDMPSMAAAAPEDAEWEDLPKAAPKKAPTSSKDVVAAFKAIGVEKAECEKIAGKPVAEWDDATIAEMRQVYASRKKEQAAFGQQATADLKG